MKDTGVKINGSPLYISDGPVSTNGLDSLSDYYYVNIERGKEGLYFFKKHKICDINYQVKNGHLENEILTMKIPKLSGQMIYALKLEYSIYKSDHGDKFAAVIILNEIEKSFSVKYFIYTKGTSYVNNYILPQKLILELRKLPSGQYPIAFVAFSNSVNIELPKDFEGFLIYLSDHEQYEHLISYVNNPIEYLVRRIPQKDLIEPLKKNDIIS